MKNTKLPPNAPIRFPGAKHARMHDRALIVAENGWHEGRVYHITKTTVVVRFDGGTGPRGIFEETFSRTEFGKGR